MTAAGRTLDRAWPSPVWLALGVAVTVWISGVVGAMAVVALAAIALATALAWNAPGPTLFGFFFCLLAVDRDLQVMLPEAWQMVQVGGARLRYSDPFLAAMTLVAGIRAYGVMLTRIGRFDRRELATWAFVLVLGAYAALGIPSYGIAAPGEMRTYYGVVLVIGYVLASVKDAPSATRCWAYMYWLGVALIFVALWRGWSLHRLAIGPESRWITAHSNLALNLACVVPLFVNRDGWRGQRSAAAWGVAGIALVLTLVNPHRSVWLATGVAFLVSVLADGVSLRRIGRVLAISVVSAGFAAMLIVGAGYDLTSFLGERLTPFTSRFYDDHNTSWRLGLWLQALLMVDAAEAWVFGLGLGEHFGIVNTDGSIVTTSPHNGLITAYFHFGLFGIGAFLSWIALLVWPRRSPETSLPGNRAARTLMMSTLGGSLAFSVAYPFPFTGLVLAAIAGIVAYRGGVGRGVDPAAWTPDPLAGSSLGRRAQGRIDG